jgi:predicted Zn-dependent protease
MDDFVCIHPAMGEGPIMTVQPASVVKRTPRRWAALLAGFYLAVTVHAPAEAQQHVTIVRDAEIEALVRDYVKPILQAAGLSKSGISVVLVNDPHFNAFVDGRRIFVNTGALAMAETPNEIIGVLAHETGHLAGHHQQQMRQQIAGPALLTGGMEFARRTLLNYQRTEETAADRSAVTYLDRTKQSPKGMLTTFRRFQSALSLSGTQVDPYLQTHPMPADRIANLKALAEASPYLETLDPPQLQLRHDLMRAKIAAFTDNNAVITQLWRKNPTGVPTAYGKALSTYLHGDLKSALAQTDALIKAMPNDPYFYELRGDILLKANHAKEAAAAYAKAVSLDPAKSGLLQVAYGQALLAMGDKASLEKAVTQLKTGLDRDKENGEGYRSLAQAYGTLGNIPDADLATAEGYFYAGGYKDAKIFAARAQQGLARGTPGWVRAQDIINFKIPAKK